MTDYTAANKAIAVLGLGYVGLPLAVAFASTGHRVVGVDSNPQLLDSLRAGRTPFHEPGLQAALRDALENELTIAAGLPETSQRFEAIIICVGTSFDYSTGAPRLEDLRAAARAAASHADERTLVVVRSTVPTGTTRSTVLPELTKLGAGGLLAMCPERTIQGKAMDELRSLPQVIGGLTRESTARAIQLFKSICERQIPVSSLEAAETVKLINNAHTDLIYGFGNEVALLSEALGLDAYELIRAANVDYPRPDLSKPGFVGGSCLVKDSYLLDTAVRRVGHSVDLIRAARQLNERLPAQIVHRILAALANRKVLPNNARVLICGIAYKGDPVTDDVRGSAAPVIAELLSERRVEVLGHDFVVDDQRIGTLGMRPVSLPEGLRDVDCIVLLSNHTEYAAELAAERVGLFARTPVVYDMWGLLESQEWPANISYLKLGYG